MLIGFSFIFSMPNQNFDNFCHRHKFIRSTIVILTSVMVIVFSFGAGMYWSAKDGLGKDLGRSEAVYLGKLTGLYSQPQTGKLSQDIDFDLFWQVWDTLKRQYVDKDQITDKELFYGALRGLVASLDDPYTIFMDPKGAQEFSDDLAGTFEGIGAEIGMKNGVITIIAPLPEMPAETAGLKAGDKIYAIDGKITAGLNVDEAVKRIRGPKGTKVTLTIVRNGMDKPKDYTITRDTIVVKSVKAEMGKDDIFIIKVSNFNDDTSDLFKKAAREAIEKNPRGIILDLRNNPGGYLDTAVDMASEWIDGGVVVSERFSNDKKNDYLAKGHARLKDIPTVVLVNQGSASASEIVAGALQDTGEAVLVGMKTFGKGSVQTLEGLKDGSSIKITVAKWLTPKGRCINDEGIIPDAEIDYTAKDAETGKDPQMEKAIEAIKSGGKLPVKNDEKK